MTSSKWDDWTTVALSWWEEKHVLGCGRCSTITSPTRWFGKVRDSPYGSSSKPYDCPGIVEMRGFEASSLTQQEILPVHPKIVQVTAAIAFRIMSITGAG